MNREQQKAMFARRTWKQIKLVKTLAKPENQQSYDFWHGVTDKYPQCCVDYYVNVYSKGKNLERRHIGNIDMDKIQTGNRIMCPDCIMKSLRKRQ